MGPFNHELNSSTTAFRTLANLASSSQSSAYSVGRNPKNNEGNFGSQKPLDQLFKVK